MIRTSALLVVIAGLGACKEVAQRPDGPGRDLLAVSELGGEDGTRLTDLLRGEAGRSDQRAGDLKAPSDRLPAFTATYYVDSAGGLDSNTGTSPGAAWKSLGKVSAQTFQPGTAIFFKGGSSWTGELTIKSSGTPAAPIVYSTYGGGPRPIIRNPGSTTSYSKCIRVTGSHVIIEGFLLKEAHEAGVHLASSSSGNVVRDVEATDVGIGVWVSGQQHLVTRSYFHDLHMVKNTQGGDDDYGATGVVLADATGCEISYNKMLRCKAPSYDYGHDGGVVEWWAASSGNLVHHNWGQSSNGFIEVGGKGHTVKDNVVSYNVSFDNDAFLVLHLGGTFGVNLQNLRVENNTIYEPDDPGQAWELIWFASAPGAGTLLLRNNLFSVGGYDAITHQAGFTHENNLYHLFTTGSKVGFPLGPGEKQADPLLVDPGQGDFHLRSGSPAINAGQSLGHALDFDGKAVPCGAAPEIGAFEQGC